MSPFEELSWRGLVSQVTHPELPGLLEKEQFTLYCGFDPTADSLHIGSLVQILGLLHFQRAGHRPIALLGGATGMIGDPVWKPEERQLITSDVVERNITMMEIQLRKFLDFSGKNAAIIANNADWLGKLHLVTFLRDIGKHFSVNVMLSRESVRARLDDRERALSYTDFPSHPFPPYSFLPLFDQ